MTAGKVAATVILSLVGAGVIGVLGTSVYNDCKYGLFTPHISAENKNMYNGIRKTEEENVYGKYENNCEKTDLNIDVKAIKENLEKKYGPKKIKALNKEVHKRARLDMKVVKYNQLREKLGLPTMPMPMHDATEFVTPGTTLVID